MSPLLEKLVERLGGHEPLSILAGKVATNARALAYGRLFLRSCSQVGRRARCFGRPQIVNEGAIRIGDDFALGCAFGAARVVAGKGAEIDIGRGVTVNYGTSIRAARHIRIGDRVLVGPFCVVEDADVATDRAHASEIEIGDDVWLAARVVVRPGAKIGAGAVIAAGSVVEGEVPANAIASGAPARVLRIRNREGQTAEASHEAIA